MCNIDEIKYTIKVLRSDRELGVQRPDDVERSYRFAERGCGSLAPIDDADGRQFSKLWL